MLHAVSAVEIELDAPQCRSRLLWSGGIQCGMERTLVGDHRALGCLHWQVSASRSVAAPIPGACEHESGSAALGHRLRAEQRSAADAGADASTDRRRTRRTAARLRQRGGSAWWDSSGGARTIAASANLNDSESPERFRSGGCSQRVSGSARSAICLDSSRDRPLRCPRV